MTGKRRVPLGKKARRAAMDEGLARAARRAAKRGRARQRETYNRRLADGLDRRALDAAMALRLSAPAVMLPHAAAGVAVGRWVPIGPSVVRHGQAVDRPRVTGRVRDLAVDGTGLRAYAGTAMGGVWYTADGGSTWAPFGGWAERTSAVGGAVNAQAIGCLLVAFGATAALDVVLAGTGEPTPNEQPTGEGALGGVGILAAVRPSAGAAAGDPWEPDAGPSTIQGLGIRRLVRSPASTAGLVSGAAQDVVLAVTTTGAYLGVRSNLPASGALPARDGYTWTLMAALDAAYPDAAISDAVWLPGGRLIMAIDGVGLVYTDDKGTTVHEIPSGCVPALSVTGVSSLAVAPGTSRVYLLGEEANVAGMWVMPDATLSPPVVSLVPGLPATDDLWGTGTKSQRDYDQAIAVDVVGATDRIYVGGSARQPYPNADYGASLYCFDVQAGALVPATNVSRTGVPPGGDGADQDGLIGNNVHADVHVIRVTGTAGPQRQVWVGTDGGVFVSSSSGRVQTFAAMSNGISSLQPVFLRGHPVSGHMVAAGFQDNGTQVRTGDTVWDEVFLGDGGGVTWVPTSPHMMVGQYVQSSWSASPPDGYIDPMTRSAGGPSNDPVGPEDGNAEWYSGAATVVAPAPDHTRLALGTNRVWLTDDLGLGAGPNTWRTLPFPSGVAADGRPGARGATTPASMRIGVPRPGLGSVIALAWASPTELLAAYALGIVRYTEGPPGSWTTKTWRLNDHRVAMPRTTTPTDILPIPGVRNFYVATLGVNGGPDETLWFYSPSDDQFHPTALRHQLDVPGTPVVVGPRDPVYALALDPVDQNVVYVGTATGVWHGHRTSNLGAHDWTPFVNGLPQATVQDLNTWVDTLAMPGSPRLLRAAVQSRGVWEVDLAADAKRTTWIRSHAWDDRRMPLAANLNPLAVPPVAPEGFTASPDIVVRPHWTGPAAPTFQSAPVITVPLALTPTYDVWTFQTAFRWLYPSVGATGVFTGAMANLVAYHRSTIGKTAVPEIDAALWTAIVGGVHVKADGTVTSAAADPLAVYRAPWQTSRAPAACASEADFGELVIPPGVIGDIWQVYRESSTVDVLLHHRDGREVPADGGYVVLLWRSAPTPAELMALPCAGIVSFLSQIAAGANPAAPAQWNVATAVGGAVKRPLPVPLDGRMPRGVSVDVDLSSAGLGAHVLFLAFVSSSADDPLAAPTTNLFDTVPPVSITDLVRCWPSTAARVVALQARP